MIPIRCELDGNVVRFIYKLSDVKDALRNKASFTTRIIFEDSYDVKHIVTYKNEERLLYIFQTFSRISFREIFAPHSGYEWTYQIFNLKSDDNHP